MKKILALLMAALLVVALAACTPKKPDETTAAPDTTAAPEETTAAPEDTTAPEETTEEAKQYMTYDEYAAAEVNAEVEVEAYVQAHQSWWAKDGVGKLTVYAAAKDRGAYFIYEMNCSEEDAAKMTEGTKIIVKGFKSEWSGEVEIADAEFEFAEDGETYVSEPIDATALLGTEELADYMNAKVSFKDLTIAAKKDADGNDAAFLYKWNGTGAQGDDIYFDVTDGTNTYTFTIESYLCDKDTEVYKTAEALKVGDKVDVEGFLYWYEGAQPHVTSITVK